MFIIHEVGFCVKIFSLINPDFFTTKDAKGLEQHSRSQEAKELI